MAGLARSDLAGRVSVFAIALLGPLAVAITAGEKTFYADSGAYWDLRDTFTEGGSFSLTTFDSPVRGYALPLIYRGLSELAGLVGAGDALAVQLFNSVLFATIGAVLLPAFARVLWPELEVGGVHRLALTALLVFFWRGYLTYPLSDFPAVAAALAALLILARSDSLLAGFAAGAAAGLALEIRPAYLLFAIAVVVLAVCGQSPAPDVARRTRWRLARGAMVLIGVALICLPQALATHRHYGIWSPIPGSAAGLTKLQLTEGLRLQRYETYVGSEYPSPRLLYLDPAGQRLLRDEAGGEVQDGAEWLRLAVEHPWTMSGVLLRHVVNGMDQRYPTTYVERLDVGGQRLFRTVGILLLFLAMLRLAWPQARHSLGSTRWRYAFALLAGCVTSLPSAVETRFLIPAYLLVYLLVVAPGWPDPVGTEGTLRRFAVPAVILVAGAVTVFSIWTVLDATTDNLVLPR